MKRIKYLLALLLLFAVVFILSLPGKPAPNILSDQKLEEYAQIPNFDYRSEAQRLWDLNEQESALLLLDEVISNNWDDKEASKELYKQYIEQIKNRESELGRLKAAGISFVTGEVNSFEELAGSSLADFFIYGDARDLTKELIFEDDANEFIVSLSGLGLITTVFPPADPMVSLLKTSYKSGSLTQPMIKHISTVLQPLKKGTSKVSVANLKGIVSQLKPIWELAGKCKSWQQFSLLMKHCKNTKQVKFLSKVISVPGNSKKLSAVLSTLKTFPKRSGEAVTFIHTYGQKGMDSLYSVMRKGPDGIQFVVKNPKLYTRLTKNAGKASMLSQQKLNSQWSKLLSEYGAPLNIVRYIIAFVLLYFIKLLLFGKIGTNGNSTPKSTTVNSGKNIQMAIWLSGGVLIAVLVLSMNSSLPQGNSLSTQTLSTATTIKSSSIIFFIVFSIVQVWSVFKARLEIEEIKKVANQEKKMRLLDNSEFYFDLPVYAGLAGTVCAFILLNFDPGGSRILAYATTVSGIAISVFIRGKWLFPVKKQVIHGDSHE